MASNYPGSLDSFDTIASDKKTSDSVGGRTHRQMHNDLGDAIEAVQAELGTDPAGDYATVKARLSANPFIGSGTGSPEGAVTGNPGQQWLQTNGVDAKGWILWRKASGTGTNTGWVVGPEADTGQRLITPTLTNGWAVYAGVFYLRRQGHRVQFTAYLDGTSASTADVWTIPSGFRPRVTQTIAAVPNGASRVALGLVDAAGALSVVYYAADIYYISTSWDTNDDWVASLPGSAA